MTPEIIGGFVRALLAGLGGILVGKGVADDATVETVAGAGAVIVTAIWSWWAKRKAAQA